MIDHPEIGWERNTITIRAEDLTRPATPADRARWAAREREQRRLVNRIRRARRAVHHRLADTWQVLRHGLPEHDCY